MDGYYSAMLCVCGRRSIVVRMFRNAAAAAAAFTSPLIHLQKLLSNQ